MGKFFSSVLSAFKSVEATAWQKLSGKALYAVAGWALMALHAKFPEIPLPGVDAIVTAIYAVGTAHTFSDFMSLAAQFLASYAAAAKSVLAPTSVGWTATARKPEDGPCPTCGLTAK